MRARWIFVVSILLFAGAASPTTFVVPSDDELFRKADAVVVAMVIGSHARLMEDGSVMTVTDSRIERVIKGSLEPGDLLSTDAPGGIVGSVRKVYHGVPHYRPSSRVLLFVFEWEPGRWATVDLTVGKFEFHADVRGREVLVRDEDEITGWDEDLRPFSDRRRDAGRFLRHLERLRRGESPSPDYFVEAAPLTTGPVATLEDAAVGSASVADGSVTATAIVPPASNYLMDQFGNLARWNTFPSPVPFRQYTIGGSAVPGANTAVQAAVSAWTNDCGSNVVLTNAGQSLRSPPQGLAGDSDGENTVRWEVDLAGVQDFVCTSNGYSGTLGLGGPNGLGARHTFDGMSYYAITEGDVDMNRGLASAACANLAQSIKNAAVAHEVGHTLNFRHSDRSRDDSTVCTAPLPCSDMAIMKASLPPGLDAVLQQWDIDAVRAVYPGSSCAVGGAIKGDFNLDSKPDLVWRNYATGAVNVWFLNGTTYLGGANLFNVADPSWRIEGVGDFNLDGKSDLIWRNYSTGAVNVWYLNGTTYIGGASLFSVTDPNWEIEAVEDFNGDDKDDLIWRNYATGAVNVWYLNGSTYLGGASLFSVTDPNWKIEAAADFNADGKADLLWRNYATGAVNVWFLNGATYLGGATLFSVANPNWNIEAVGDYNGDGKADLIWRDYGSGAVNVWFLNNTTYLSGASLFSVTDVNWQIAGPR